MLTRLRKESAVSIRMLSELLEMEGSSPLGCCVAQRRIAADLSHARRPSAKK